MSKVIFYDQLKNEDIYLVSTKLVQSELVGIGAEGATQALKTYSGRLASEEWKIMTHEGRMVFWRNNEICVDSNI